MARRSGRRDRDPREQEDGPRVNRRIRAREVRVIDPDSNQLGIMSVEDAKRAVDIGCTGIMVSNHGGRQLDGSRAPFDQLAEICDAVGDKIDVICEGGIQRGTHVLKALSVGAKACSGGRLYLYALAAAGEAGVDRVLGNMKVEIERDMKLMGITSLDQLSRENLRWR